MSVIALGVAAEQVVSMSARKVTSLRHAEMLARLAAADAAVKAADKEHAAARAAVLAELDERNVPFLKSDAHLVTLKVTSAATLDSAAVKKEMGDAWWSARCKNSVRRALTITHRDDN